MRSHKRKQETVEENGDKIENSEKSDQGQKRDRKGKKIADNAEEPQIFE